MSGRFHYIKTGPLSSLGIEDDRNGTKGSSVALVRCSGRPDLQEIYQ